MVVSIVGLEQEMYNPFSRWLLAWKEIGLNSKEEVKLWVLDEHDQRRSELMVQEDKSYFSGV